MTIRRSGRKVAGRTAGLAVAVVLSAWTPGCSGRSSATRPPDRPQEASRAEPAAPAQARGGAGGATARAGEAGPAPLESMAASRRLVRTGRIAVEVASYAAAATQATRLAEGLHGYLADSQSSRSEHGRVRGILTLRVPAEQFVTLVEGSRALGTVRSENVSAQDVTRAYADVETRLRVKRQTAERLQQILATRTAGLADVLQAERELARVTEEIEALEGERRYYDQQIALSTLSLELSEPEPLVRAGFLDPVRDALGRSLELLGGSLAALLALVVVAAPWALAVSFAWWALRRLLGKGRPPRA